MVEKFSDIDTKKGNFRNRMGFLPKEVYSIYFTHGFIVKEKIRIWIVFLYGLVILGLGYIGYKEAGSKASLWCGAGFGALLMISAQIMRSKQAAGLSMALGFSTLLTGVFSYRYMKTGKEIPAVLAITSAGMLLYLLLSILGKKKSSRP